MPRWRTMIEPAETNWPSPALTPRRWPTLSRPFFELERVVLERVDLGLDSSAVFAFSAGAASAAGLAAGFAAGFAAAVLLAAVLLAADLAAGLAASLVEVVLLLAAALVAAGLRVVVLVAG